VSTQHPITPPPELVKQWRHSWLPGHGEFVDFIATRAAQWGANQELEACVNWLIENQNPRWAHVLRDARRPKPLTLKEQALAKTTAILNDPNRALLVEVRETLELNLLALKALND
jgi:hypothetical protein